jgi:polyketide-type polyunsaturated fatty acid synthase PfaA
MKIKNKLGGSPIAIIGMSAMFADASHIEHYWENIIALKDSIIDVPANRWKIEDYYNSDYKVEDKTYCKRGGFLPDIDFDPMDYGLPPNLLESTDVSQLLALSAAQDALADAGYNINSTALHADLRAKTGVILGVGGGQKLITPLTSRLQAPIWERALRASNISEEQIPDIIAKIKKAYIGWNEDTFPGLLGNIIAGRICNRFDLGGINSVVDAACASSLSAINMAVNELVHGNVDMILTGGVDTDNSPFMYMSFSKTPAFSRKGHIKPFDEHGDGMLIGEGLGIVVLKRLADAERDNDRIYAVIKGVGTSSDGKFKSIYAPRSLGQVLAMQRAYDDAGYEPSTVGLIEAHGTGTNVGDHTELTSMQTLFGANNTQKQNIALGSVKSQIGHTKSAAGAAGIIKAALALYHKVLPGTINVETPNKKFDFPNTPFFINKETKPWFATTHPRRASLSAFGFGGINVHITMQEHNHLFLQKDIVHNAYHQIIITANNEAALIEKVNHTINSWNTDERTFLNYINNLNNSNPIKQTDAKLGFVSSSVKEAINKLQEFLKHFKQGLPYWESANQIFYSSGQKNILGKVAGLFTGQGSQYTNMGADLAIRYPAVFNEIEAFDNTFQQIHGHKLSTYIYPIAVFNEADKKKQIASLTNTAIAQPAIGALSLGLFNVFTQTGFNAQYLAGHSFGELTALCAAGVVNNDSYRTLAVQRGKLMAAGTQHNGEATGMMAIKITEEKLQQYLQQHKEITLANINSIHQMVVGGKRTALEILKVQLVNNNIEAIMLPVSNAFHTKYVAEAQTEFAKIIDKQTFSDAKQIIVRNQDGLPYALSKATIKKDFKTHMLQPVQFKKQIEYLYAQGVRTFVEFGTKNILCNLLKDILVEKDFQAVCIVSSSTKSADYQLKSAHTKLMVLGMPLNSVSQQYRKRIIPKATTKTTVQLNGGFYKSERMQKAYQQELAKAPLPVVASEQIFNQSNSATIIEENNMQNQEFLNLMRESLAHIKDQQSKTLQSFESLMATQHNQNQAFLNMIAQVYGINGNVQQQLPIAPTMAQIPTKPSVAAISAYQPVTITPVQQAPIIETLKPQEAPIPSTPIAVATVYSSKATAVSSNGSHNSMEKQLLEIVSEKTGYPIEMLDVDMDMESDLGIDSIKRVEIFGAVTERNPNMQKIDPQIFAELRTLKQVVEKVSGSAPSITNTIIEPQIVNAPSNHKATAHEGGNGEVSTLLLDVVSEKTGYPIEMLELGMDMEADLGIDSIKRVEIFGSIKERFVSAATLDPQALAELRTLQSVVDYVSTVSSKK